MGFKNKDKYIILIKNNMFTFINKRSWSLFSIFIVFISNSIYMKRILLVKIGAIGDTVDSVCWPELLTKEGSFFL